MQALFFFFCFCAYEKWLISYFPFLTSSIDPENLILLKNLFIPTLLTPYPYIDQVPMPSIPIIVSIHLFFLSFCLQIIIIIIIIRGSLRDNCIKDWMNSDYCRSINLYIIVNQFSIFAYISTKQKQQWTPFWIQICNCKTT